MHSLRIESRKMVGAAGSSSSGKWRRRINKGGTFYILDRKGPDALHSKVHKSTELKNIAVMEEACVQHGAFINKCGYLNGNIIIRPIFKYRERERKLSGEQEKHSG